MRWAILLALAAGAGAQPINSIKCTAATMCTTTWPVAPGNLLVVYGWGKQSGGAFSDSAKDVFTTLNQSDQYASHKRMAVTLGTGAGPLTVMTPGAWDNLVVAEFPGYTAAVLTSAVATVPSVTSKVSCPAIDPLSITTTEPALLISMWAMESSFGSACTASSGTELASQCSGPTGKLMYEMAAAGAHSQRFSFQPGYNGGDSSCAIFAFKVAIPPAPPPYVAPPPTPDPVVAVPPPGAFICPVNGVPSIICQHNLGTITPYVACYDSANYMAGSTGAASDVRVVAVRATSPGSTTIDFGIIYADATREPTPFTGLCRIQ